VLSTLPSAGVGAVLALLPVPHGVLDHRLIGVILLLASSRRTRS
jgi:hypothetical protein